MLAILISEEFAKKNKGFSIGVNTFDYSELNSGEFICSIESLRNFPELFNGISVSFRDINENDFKQQNIENG